MIKVTTQFIGRMGNNLFQAAACIGYAKKYGVKWGVPNFSKEVRDFHKIFPGLPLDGGLNFKRYNEHPNAHCNKHGVHMDKCHFNYHEIPFSPDGVRLVGFFQSEKYFENAKEEVKKAFSLKYVDGLHEWVSIHVRRGDYVQYADSFPPITMDYITKAMHEMTSRGFYKFLVFSDDIQWCKQNIADVDDASIDIKFSEGKDHYTDLVTMASCGNHIIANSSYSWWAAWLGLNDNKVVVSPSHTRGNWFGLNSGVKMDCIDLIPESWIQIKFR